jgi:beta-lactam-binding protein with PASTA domain/PKD repeat protein
MHIKWIVKHGSSLSQNLSGLIVFIFLILSGGIELIAANLPSGFSESTVPGPTGNNWNEAVGMTFDATGRMYVWERAGKVWIREYGTTTWQLLLDISEEVGSWGDYGLLGFAIDPDFRVNGRVYLLYGVDRHYLLNFGTPNYNPAANEYNQATIGRITRYTARASDSFRSIDYSTRFVLVGDTKSSGFPLTHDSHGVGTLAFGSDGTLLASCGDGASWTVDDVGSGPDTAYAQALADGIIQPKENVGAYRAQLVDSLSGKILRIDPVTGNGLPGNPFFDPSNPRAARSRVWALGLRNPYRFTVRPQTGSHFPEDANPGVLYIGDVGYVTWEELNICSAPGQNFGWPVYEGVDIHPSYSSASPSNRDALNPLYPNSGCSQYFLFRDLIKQNTTVLANQPPYNNPCNGSQKIPLAIPQFQHSPPAIDWKHFTTQVQTWTYNQAGIASPVNIGSGSPVSGSMFAGNCSIGGVWYTGTDFPVQFRNTYFHAEYGDGWIKSFVFDANNKPVSISNFASVGGAIIGLTTHPIDGNLYYISGLNIRRITYASSGNLPPTAIASADNLYGPGPLSVQFTGTNSSDPERLPLSYSWQFGDGTPDSTQANPLHTFTAVAGVPTPYRVTLTVTDSTGQTSSTTILIAVNNTPPAVTITSPLDNALYPMSAPTVFNLTANVLDAESPDSQLTYTWQKFLHHDNHEHPDSQDTNHITTTLINPIGCDGVVYYYRIELTVTDPTGLSTRKEIKIFPDCGAPNTPPTISDISDQTTAVGVSVGPIPFIVGDAETQVANLQVAANSSNPALVPNGNIAFGGGGANRTVTISPLPGQAGTTTITISVTDGPSVVSDSFTLTVTGTTTPPSTVVATYAFDEGSGDRVADASGNGNFGSLNQTTWTAGKFGNALSFNGSSSWVAINHVPSMNLARGMTLEAWVYPTTATGWRTIIMKETSSSLAFALYGNDNASRSAIYVNTGGSDVAANGTSQLPLNTWTHLAATFDGSSLRLYVNGSLIRTQSVSGSIISSTGPLRIGGNAIWNEFFAGRIDEVRIYSRALTASEIQSDMTTPITVSNTTVPDVILQSQSAALSSLTSAGLSPGSISTASSSTVNAGFVLSQTPTFGTQVPVGSSVDLLVSSGPPPIPAPNLVGQTESDAIITLNALGLNPGSLDRIYSGTVTAGIIISQTPTSGTPVAPGSAINVKISLGPPPPVIVPGLLDQSFLSASNLIIISGLSLGTVSSQSSSTVSEGKVLSQSPDAGAQVVAGSSVSFILSSGPPLIVVPNVVGKPQLSAQSMITAAGLAVGTVSQAASSSIPSGSVASQSPGSGTQIPIGGMVNLVISTGAPPVVILAEKLVFSDGNGARTTAGFSSQGAGRVLIAFAASDGPTSGGQQLTISGAGLTWQLVKRSNGQLGSAEIWSALAPNQLNNVTVKSTQKNTAFHQSLTIVVFSGAKGVGASNASNSLTGAPTVSLTTTAANSLVYGVGNDWTQAISRSIGQGQSMLHEWVDTAVGDSFWVQWRTSPVDLPSQVQLNDVAPTANRWNFAAVEILSK